MYDISLVIHTSAPATHVQLQDIVRTYSELKDYIFDSHPDLRMIAPLEEKVSISIDQVHGIHTDLTLSPVRGTQKVILIHPAHALTLPAQQALLKLVEEPPSKVLFLLVTHTPHVLLPTILSRCRLVSLQVIGESIERGTSPISEVPKNYAEAIKLSDEYGAKKESALKFIQEVIQTQKDPTIQKAAIKALGLLTKNINAKLVLDKFFFSILSS